MNTALAGPDAAVFMDSGFRRNDEASEPAPKLDCFVASLLAMTEREPDA